MSCTKNGQTATEYLVILAVAIIIALIVIGVLGGILGIGGNSKNNAADIYWQSSDLGVVGFNIRAGTLGNDSIKIRNNLVSDILVYNVTLDVFSISNHTKLNITILSGNIREFSFSEIDGIRTNGEIKSKFNICDTLQHTDDFTVPLTITYLEKETNSVYSFSGEENVKGTCSR